MNKHIIFSGHTRINPHLLEVISKDVPVSTGKKEYLLCTFSHYECKNNCYAHESVNCSKYRLLNQFKSRYDKFGVMLK